jgi:hypothetical protein
MASHNDITGDALVSRFLSPEGQAQFDIIFGVKKKERYVPPPLPDWGEEASEKRLDIIGANGPTGEHYEADNTDSKDVSQESTPTKA